MIGVGFQVPSRKALAQLRAGSHWLGVESGRHVAAALHRSQRLCQRCDSGEVDDEAHMVFRCAALSVQRRELASLFLPWPADLRDSMSRDPTGVCVLLHSLLEVSTDLSRHPEGPRQL